MTRKPLPKIRVKTAEIWDLDDVCRLATEFFTQEGFDSEDYDPVLFRASAREWIENGAVLLALHETKAVGYYAVSIGQVYSFKPIMYEAHFCVSKDYVLSHAGRMLSSTAIELGRSLGCLCFYAGATSGIKRFDNSLINMYSKLGFQSCGGMVRYKY